MASRKHPASVTRPNAFAESIRERVAVLVRDPARLGDLLDTVASAELAGCRDYLTRRQYRALGWLEGAAEALDMTVLEFVDANT